MSTWMIGLATIGFIVLSAFFVAVEFALLAARAHRLEAMAEHSAAARAAVRNSHELSLLLAGSQLGITVCTLALGSVTKPAVHHALTPAAIRLGMPDGAADVASFVLALVLVTLLHLVVGEMAPKSWAIAHPERSAALLSIPMRAFMWFTRPVLRALNTTANRLVRWAGATPVDTLTVGHDPRSLRALVEHSAAAGTLEAPVERPLSAALALADRRVADLVDDQRPITAVGAGATADEVQRAAWRSGHLRVLLGEPGRYVATVHVRDTLTMSADAGVGAVSRPLLELDAETPLHQALTRMQQTSTQLAMVCHDGRQTGLLSIHDILPELLPR